MKQPRSNILWSVVVVLAGLVTFFANISAPEAQKNILSWWALAASIELPSWLTTSLAVGAGVAVTYGGLGIALWFGGRPERRAAIILASNALVGSIIGSLPYLDRPAYLVVIDIVTLIGLIVVRLNSSRHWLGVVIFLQAAYVMASIAFGIMSLRLTPYSYIWSIFILWWLIVAVVAASPLEMKWRARKSASLARIGETIG